jgi:hypothetical protein
MHDNEPWHFGRKPIHKAAGVRCPHQRHHKGCAIYRNRPFCCQMWNCRWLVNDDTADLPRPDRAHYVIDIMPDVIRARDDNTGKVVDYPAIQVWVDRDYPAAHRDPALRAYLARRGEQEGAVAIIRYSESDGFVLIPPALNDARQWIEHESTAAKRKNFLSPPDTWTATHEQAES